MNASRTSSHFGLRVSGKAAVLYRACGCRRMTLAAPMEFANEIPPPLISSRVSRLLQGVHGKEYKVFHILRRCASCGV